MCEEIQYVVLCVCVCVVCVSACARVCVCVSGMCVGVTGPISIFSFDPPKVTTTHWPGLGINPTLLFWLQRLACPPRLPPGHSLTEPSNYNSPRLHLLLNLSPEIKDFHRIQTGRFPAARRSTSSSCPAQPHCPVSVRQE